MLNKDKTFFLIEKGWGGAKQYANGLSQQGKISFMLVKGIVPIEILNFLNSNNSAIKVTSIYKQVFHIAVIMYLLLFSWIQRFPLTVVVTKESTLKWVGQLQKLFKFNLKLIQEISKDGKMEYHLT